MTACAPTLSTSLFAGSLAAADGGRPERGAAVIELTVPVIAPEPGAVIATDAFNVTGCPAAWLDGLAVTVVLESAL